MEGYNSERTPRQRGLERFIYVETRYEVVRSDFFFFFFPFAFFHSRSLLSFLFLIYLFFFENKEKSENHFKV